MVSFQDFFNEYNGEKNVGNTPQNLGQCVGLVEVYIKGFGYDQVWGNADDLYTNAPDVDFLKIPNSPTAIPIQGDIIVWSQQFNSSVGHTGICTGKADINTFDCFEQNDPLGSNCHVKTYNYAFVVGWLRPKIASVPTVTITQAELDQIRQDRDQHYNDLQAEIAKNTDLQTKLTQCENSKVVSTIPTTVPIPVSTSADSNSSTPSQPQSDTQPTTTDSTTITTQPLPMPQPIKPPMTTGSSIVFFFTNIFNTLKSWWTTKS